MEGPFEIVYPGNVLEAFRKLCRRANKVGQLEEVKAAVIKIEAGLRADPYSFGDPCYPLRATKQEVFMRGVPPLVIYYAVHQDKKVVFVKSILWNKDQS